MSKSIAVSALAPFLEGSDQYRITMVEAQVKERFGDKVRVVASHPDKVIILHEGGVSSCKLDKGGLGECEKMDVELKTPVDEAVDLRERLVRMVEAYVIAESDGRKKIVEDAVGGLLRFVRPEHVMASELLSEQFDVLLAERPWLKAVEAKHAEHRNALYGKLGMLKERELRPAFKTVQTAYAETIPESEAERVRHSVLPALNRVAARLREQEKMLGEVTLPEGMTAPEEVAALDDLKNFYTQVLDDVAGLRQALEQKLRLDARTADVLQLCKLHDSVVERVNRLDFATELVRTANAKITGGKR